MATTLKLTPTESLRACGILEEALEKLSFLGSITPDILQHREELSQIVGEEISRIIQEQRQLEAKYEKLISQRSILKVTCCPSHGRGQHANNAPSSCR
ncbi:hypothetical protein PINS_up019322 [Pythium insidiosum]|nr:hypothetical protein PINS_up019322 [Pythium insidiosum]